MDALQPNSAMVYQLNCKTLAYGLNAAQGWLISKFMTPDTGYKAMAYEIVKLAVEDVQNLQVMKLIENGQPKSKWPKRQKRLCARYQAKAEVESLLQFMRGGPLDLWLGMLGNKVSATAINHRLGL